ncbi:MAG: amidohydrolase [Gammaproteobacteria bacterium MedPE]|nr:MAG: amidohydrolase [Gammaproteobacteria bacterium MedPE]
MIKKALSSAIIAGLASQSVLADQTSPVLGMHHKTPDLMAFTNATIYTSPNVKLTNATLVIENGHIKSVSKNGKLPKGASVVDAKGLTIYPGFIDVYSEYGIDFSYPSSKTRGPVYRIDRIGGNAANGAIHAQMNWSDHFAPDQKAAQKYLKNGFTAVQTAKHDGILQGRGVTVSLADGIANELVYNANAQHFASFNKGSSAQNYPSSLMGSIALLRQTFSDANWYQKSQGKSVTFAGDNIEYNAALQAISNIEKQGVFFSSQSEQSLLRAAKLLKNFDIKATFLGSGFEYARLDEIGQLNANLVMPLTFAEKPTLGTTQGHDISLADLRHWERNPGNLATLEDSKLTLAITSHGTKGNDFLTNLRTAVKHGLSEKAALAALTTNPAQIAGIANEAGQLKAGYNADFVITKGDIFKNGDIVSVWTQGQEHQFVNPTHLAMSGDYSLNSHHSDEALSVSIDLAGKKAKVTIKQGDKTLKTSNVEKTSDSVSFVVTENDQAIRYRLWQGDQQNALEGRQIDSQQQSMLVTANKVAKDAKATETSADDSIEYVGKLTWPNRAFGQATLPKSQKLHLKNATVWTSEDAGILDNTDVIVANGKFVKIGKNLRTPSGYQAIDATGKHITAGIVDEHSHIAISRGVNEGTEAITAEVRIGDVVNPDDIQIYRSLAGGTTTAQLLHGSANPIGGQAQIIQLKWGESAQNMKMKNVPGSIKFALGENVKQSNWGSDYRTRYPQTRMGVEAVMKDAFVRTKEYKAAQKAYAELSRSEKRKTAPIRKDYRLETLDEILKSQRHVHIHSYVQSEILMFLRLAEQFDFTVTTFTHILEGYKLADEMAKHGAGGSTFADWWGYKFEVYDAIPQNACLMNQRGVLTSINSDSPDLQRRLNQEAAKSITYCDMSQEDAWKMVTINPAKQLKIDNRTGSIKTGKQADFVIWDHNPLSVYARAEQTWIDGRQYFDLATDMTARKAQRVEKSQLINKLIGDKSPKVSSTALSASEKMIQPVWHCDDQHDTWQQHIDHGVH